MAGLVSHGPFHAATELPHGMLLRNQSTDAISASCLRQLPGQRNPGDGVGCAGGPAGRALRES